MIKKIIILVIGFIVVGSVCAEADAQIESDVTINQEQILNDADKPNSLRVLDSSYVSSMTDDQARLLIIAVLCGVYGAYKLWSMAHGATTELVMQALAPVPGVCSVSDFLCNRFMPTKEMVAASVASGLLMGGLAENVQFGLDVMQSHLKWSFGLSMSKHFWTDFIVPAICAV